MACFAEVPYYGYDSTIAWDSSYSEIETLEGDLHLTFNVKQGSLGVVMGLSDVDDTAHYTDIDFGLYFWQGTVQAIEGGVKLGPVLATDQKWQYIIGRVGDQVVYTRQDTLLAEQPTNYYESIPGIPIIGELIYASTASSIGPLTIDSSFYAAGDSACIDEWETGFEVGGGGAAYGELPLELMAFGRADSEDPLTSRVIGKMGLDGSATGKTSSGVYDGKLYLKGKGYDFTVDAGVDGYLTFTGSGIGQVALEQTSIAVVNGVIPLNGSGFTGEDIGTGIFSGELGLQGSGFGRPDLDPALTAVLNFGELPLDIFVRGSAQYTNYFAIQLPELSDSLFETQVELTEEIQASIAMQANLVNQVREFINIASSTQTFRETYVDVVDAAQTVASTLTAFAITVQETYNVTDTLDLVQVVAISEQLVADGYAQTFYQGVIAVLSAMLASDGVVPAYATTASDSLTVGDSTLQQVTRIAQLLEAMQVADSLQQVLTVAVEIDESFTVDDSAELTAQLLAELLDTAQVYGLFKTVGYDINGKRLEGEVATWVMNTEGAQPISEYDNYEFTSLTFYKDQLYGSTDAGLYVLTGDNDAGTAIEAQLNSLMLDFGTGRQKRIRSAYLGYTSTNELVLKVRAVSDGQLSEHWYKAQPVTTADAPREGYMHVGQGLKSRYWQFELTNVGGGDFEIDQLELHPIFLSRRV